jgi:hypothetical protein
MSARRLAHVSIDRDLYERAQEAAARDRRSLSNWLHVTVERALENEPDGQHARTPAVASEAA